MALVSLTCSLPTGARAWNKAEREALLAEVAAVTTDRHGWAAIVARVMDPQRRPRPRTTAELDARA